MTALRSTQPTAPIGSGSRKGWLHGILLDWNKLQFVLGLLLIVLFGLTPLMTKSAYMMNIIIATIIYAYVGISWNITGGFGGQLLFGHISFFGVGAYCTMILLTHFGVSPWIGIPLSMIPAAILGYLVAFITLRYGLKLDYFALFTIALMVILRILFGRWEFAGAARGIWVDFKGESLARMAFVEKAPYLYISLGLLLIALIVSYIIYRSKLGLYLMALRDNEDASSALGINLARYKTWAVMITAALHGMGGGIYAMFTTFVQPIQIFGLQSNVELLVAPIIGGRGTIIGPILGAMINKPVAELTRGWAAGGREGTTLLVYGAFLMFFVLFIPRGVEGWLHRLYNRMRDTRVKHEELARE